MTNRKPKRGITMEYEKYPPPLPPKPPAEIIKEDGGFWSPKVEWIVAITIMVGVIAAAWVAVHWRNL